jgi:arylsulfatase A-like enzyme
MSHTFEQIFGYAMRTRSICWGRASQSSSRGASPQLCSYCRGRLSDVTERRSDNLLIVHWHDTGRWLGVYGHPGVRSPRLDRLAAEGILFTSAHAAAPQRSPSRGAIFTGRYPHSNGLIGLAHHGFEYREGVRTLPQILSDTGWYSALFGMQHETSYPSRLGFDEFDVSDSHCEYVVARAQEWLTESAPLQEGSPFLLTAGFFETHRPWSRDRYQPAPVEDVEVPDYEPDIPEVRGDFADFYGAIAVADVAVGWLLDTLADTGLDANTWVVFFSDHGAPFPRAKSMLYGAGTEISLIIRPPRRLGIPPRVYDELFSGVDVLPTLLELLGMEVPADVEGISHAEHLLRSAMDVEPVRRQVFTEKTFHDSFDPMRAIRTKEYSYIENYAPRHLVDLPLDIQDSPSGKAVAPFVAGPRPPRELYDLIADPSELNNLLIGDEPDRMEPIASELALRLHQWREETGDVCPSEFAGSRILIERSETYVTECIRTLGIRPTSRSPFATERGVREVTGSSR